MSETKEQGRGRLPLPVLPLSLTYLAVALNMTQPAVSRMLERIEDGYGVPLFERTTQGVVPTTLDQIFERAKAEGRPTGAIADELAMEVIAKARRGA